MGRYVVGVDGGGTKTLALISDLEGRILGAGTAGPSNYHIVGIDNAKSAIRKAVSQALSRAGVKGEKISAVCYGLAGLDSPKDIAIMKPHLEGLGFAEKTLVVHDSHIALMGATAGEPGVIVIAGTGSVAAGVNESGQYVRSGGWGPVIGDEGSAYYIAREGIVAALKYYDGRGPKTLLLEGIMRELQLETPEDIIGFVYTCVIDFSRIASIAPIVSRLASEGDLVAQDILRNAGKELADLAIAVIKRLGLKDRSFPLALVGGAFKAGHYLLDEFKSRVLSFAPRAKLSKPRFPPAIGALLLALKELKVELTDTLIGNLERTYAEILS